MKLKKYLGLVVIATFIVSCSKDNKGVDQLDTLPLEDRPITLDIDAFGPTEEDSDLKAWNYTLGSNGISLDLNAKDQPGKDEVDIPSVCVLANGNTKYVFNFVWKKKKGENLLVPKNSKLPQNDITGKRIKLSAGNWFLSGVLDKTANGSNANITFDPNNFGGVSKTNLGVYATGTKLSYDVPIYLPWSLVKVEKSGSEFIGYAKQKKGNPLNFKSYGNVLRITVANEAAYIARVKGISLESNVLRTSSGSFNLANTTTPTAGAMPFTWTPTQTQDEQPFIIDNYSLSAKGQNGSTFSKSYVLWAAPITNAKPRTHIVAEVKRQIGGAEKVYPQMNRLYIWGSTGQPSSGKKFVAKATIAREKQILEYFSYDRIDGEYSVYDARSLFSATETRKLPHISELYGLGPKLPKNSGLQNFKGSGDATIQGVTYRVNGTDGTYTDIFRNGKVMYGLRSDAAGRRYYAAWRYTPNKGKMIIESVYLGKHYKGDINDIASDSFWTIHQQDVIRREFRTGRMYTNPRQIRLGGIVSAAEGTDEQTFYTMANSILSVPFAGFRENVIINTPVGSVLPIEKPGTPWPND